MRHLIIVLVLFAAVSISAQTKAAPPKVAANPIAEAKAPADRLPVKRVVLYKNGVGYFEHTGQVHGTQELSIDFTSGQLNDVIKSLTVLDLGQGKISGVRYNSTAPLSERLKGLRLPVGEETTLSGFLAALRGARVEIRSGAASATGRLLSVDERDIKKGEFTTTVTEASVVSDSGEVRLFEVTPSTSIRIVEHDLNMEVGKYMGLVSSTRERDVRRMIISAEGTGDRPLFVSYISEVPIWKSTYRIVLPTDPKAKPLLQGWAIVDNTVGEDWKDVQLSLVAGAPQSFIQQIAQPYYSRRPSVAMPQAFQLSPQTHEETIESANAPPPPPAAGLTDYESRGLASKTERLGSGGGVYRVGGGVGSGVGGGVIGGAISGPKQFDRLQTMSKLNRPPSTTESVDVAAQASAVESEAEGKDLGDLFEYNLKQRVTIGKNQSALVPIVHANIEADKVSLWNPSYPRALRAVWVNNTSGLSLDAGTFNILEDNTFAGEGLLDVIKPGEKRLLSYAVDQGIHIDAQSKYSSERVTRVRIVHGVLTQTRGQREKRTYTIRNADAKPRNVVIEHPVRAGWKLMSEVKPLESTASYHRFRIPVEANKTSELLVEELRPTDTTIQVSNISDEEVTLLLRQQTISPELEKTLRAIIAQRSEMSGFEMQIQNRRRETNDISQDQQRLRENMKALKGTAEEKALTQRYASQLNQQEDRLATVRKEIETLEPQRDKSQEKLSQMIEDISMDVTM
ncbi:MAG: hypothetical protein JWN45_2788 [Acidobacteriaceae bacterium]|nr:hypothetical protein [Acidobacteriaceae bacterium]